MRRKLFRQLTLVAVAISFSFATSSSFSTTDTSAPVQVIARVGASCRSVVATTLAFGTLPTSPELLVTQTDGTGTLSIDCTNGTAYAIVANSGVNASGAQRRLRIGATAVYMNYDIYTTSARSTSYPTTGTAQSGTSDSTIQVVTIYGRVPGQTVMNNGTFADTLTFTITY